MNSLAAKSQKGCTIKRAKLCQGLSCLSLVGRVITISLQPAKEGFISHRRVDEPRVINSLLQLCNIKICFDGFLHVTKGTPDDDIIDVEVCSAICQGITRVAILNDDLGILSPCDQI